jgi:hypothetical protein
MASAMNHTLQAAQAYQQAGIAVLPIARSGLKNPATELLPSGHWDCYQSDPPTLEKVAEWYDRSSPPGIATIGGKVSGNLEIIDFDRKAEVIFPEWKAIVEEECPGLLAKLSIVQTPRPGFHVRYRCPAAVIPGTLHPAREWAWEIENNGKWKKATLIETRGEGGYALAPGTPPECHKTRRLYVHLSGPKTSEVQTITPEERETLLRVAAYFDCSTDAEKPSVSPDGEELKEEAGTLPNGHTETESGLRPGEDFDRNGPDWSEILCPAGWVLVRTNAAGVSCWRRPGKDASWSATTGKCKGSKGEPLFRVFSSNADPFEADKAYGKFRAYALLYHNGNRSAAARDLAAKGFGTHRKSPHVNGMTKPPVESKSPLIYPLPALMKMDLPEPKWVVAGLLCEGFNLLAGKPKLGKSWLALNLAITVAAGGKALGSMKVEAGDVLYLSLEDRLRRVQDRSKQVLKGLSLEANSRLFIAVEWPCQDQGGLAEIEKWVRSVPNPRLVIVDVWTRIRPAQNSRANAYQQDYSQAIELKTLADRLGITVLIIFHCRKAKADDVFDEVNATLGLGGAVDGQMVLLRARNEYDATLAITGRDLEEKELAVQFDKVKATWTLLGDKAAVAGSKLQSAVLAVLVLRPWLTPKEIADDCGLDRKTVTATCSRMVDNGTLRRSGSKYAAKDPTESVFK